MAAFVYLATPRGLLGLLVLVLFSFGPPDGVYCADAPYTNPSGLLIARGTRHKKTAQKAVYIGDPTGIRTPVTAVKGRCPRPLDDGVIWGWYAYTLKFHLLQAFFIIFLIFFLIHWKIKHQLLFTKKLHYLNIKKLNPTLTPGLDNQINDCFNTLHP